MTGNLLCFHLALTHLISYFVCLADGVQLALNFAFGRIKFLIDTVASTSFVSLRHLLTFTVSFLFSVHLV